MKNANKKFLAIGSIISVIMFFLSNIAGAATIGLVADVHAGTKKSNKQNMNKFLDIIEEIKSKKDVDTIIMLGDLADKGQAAFYDQAKNIEDVVWVKGNKDGKKFSILAPGNYVADFDDFRVIVLDSNAKKKNGGGGLEKSQIAWLKEKENTEKDIIVAMHHPIFKRGSHKFDKKTYAEFMDALTPNVKMVAFGHQHTNYEKREKGIRFIAVGAAFKGVYKIVKF